MTTAGNPKSARRWSAARGGNRLATRLRQELVGDARTLEHLDAEHERRKVTLPTVHFGERWVPLTELEQCAARTDRRRNARYLRQLGWIVLPVPEWWG
jgi:hypothetical protein